MSRPENAADPVIGLVLGTEDATPTTFWFLVRAGASVQLDDLVVVTTRKPDGKAVQFYGMVDSVRKRHEGIQFESDVEDVLSGVLPAAISYAARVLVTRVRPEDFIPPQPGDPVSHATGEALRMALSADKMKEAAFAAGMLTDGQWLPLNFRFVNGDSGGHINISGISGVATKTSYALFLLHSIFKGGVMDRVAVASGGRQGGSASGRAIIFNVKGEDLLFLDKPNAKYRQNEADACAARGLTQDRYALMNLPAQPFERVQFLAPPRGHRGEVLPNTEQRQQGVTPFLFTLREFCLRRMLPYVFSDAGSSLNLDFVIGNVEEKLVKLAEHSVGTSLQVADWNPEDEDTDTLPENIQFEEVGNKAIQNFSDLISYLEYKLLEENDGAGDAKWVLKQSPATLRAFTRRLRGVQKHLLPLIRGDLTEAQAQKYRPQLVSGPFQLSVVDIHNLSGPAQMFVVGVLLREVFEYKEKNGRQDTVFVVLDELNKYAPRDEGSPIKDVLLDIAERGRSLGIILIGAQQTASEVERRIVSNAAIRVVGRLDLAEAERPEYRFLPQSFRARAGILQPGTMLVSQPDVPNPVLVSYPFPAWATRRDEVEERSSREELQHLID